MVRQIIQIDEEKCNGCGACANACREGAIDMVNGKAHLMRDDYCDGLGNCLPACPTGAIRFIEREAAEYDEAAAMENVRRKKEKAAEAVSPAHACPGSMAKTLERPAGGCPGSRIRMMERDAKAAAAPGLTPQSQLRQWPVQIKLVPVNAPYFNGANLLVAADCTAYAYAAFHQDFIRGKITLIGCPKLDDIDYSEKLTAIIRENDIKSVTIVRMEVPCCGGLEYAVKTALQNSGRFIPWQVRIISTTGEILE